MKSCGAVPDAATKSLSNLFPFAKIKILPSEKESVKNVSTKNKEKPTTWEENCSDRKPQKSQKLGKIVVSVTASSHTQLLEKIKARKMAWQEYAESVPELTKKSGKINSTRQKEKEVEKKAEKEKLKELFPLMKKSPAEHKILHEQWHDELGLLFLYLDGKGKMIGGRVS